MIELKSARTPTNGDRIRAMSDKGLAEWLTRESENHANIICDRCICGKPGMCTEDTICALGVLDWLRQPAGECET